MPRSKDSNLLSRLNKRSSLQKKETSPTNFRNSMSNFRILMFLNFSLLEDPIQTINRLSFCKLSFKVEVRGLVSARTAKLFSNSSNCHLVSLQVQQLKYANLKPKLCVALYCFCSRTTPSWTCSWRSSTGKSTSLLHRRN